MPAGRYLRTALLGWVQGDAMPTAPTSLWAHLCTSAPGAASLGTAPTIGGYDPIELVGASDWAAIATGANVDTLNPAADLTFGPFDNSGDETATHFMLTLNEVPDADEIVGYAALGASRLMTDGGVVTIAATDLDVTA